MMKDDHTLESWLHRIGFIFTRAQELVGDTARRAGAFEERLEERLHDRLEHSSLDPDDLARMGAWGAGAAASLVLSRVLRPRPVDWKRAALAGVLATLAYDVVSWLDESVGTSKKGTISAPHLPRDAEAVAATLARYTAGVGLAMVYARYVHRRIPGPRVVGGLTFGMADGAAGAAGGLLPLAHQLAPSVPLPFEPRGLSAGARVTLRTLLRHAAFGATLGAVYDDP